MPIVNGDIALLPLNIGVYAIIDADDAALAAQSTWFSEEERGDVDALDHWDNVAPDRAVAEFRLMAQPLYAGKLRDTDFKGCDVVLVFVVENWQEVFA